MTTESQNTETAETSTYSFEEDGSLGILNLLMRDLRSYQVLSAKTERPLLEKVVRYREIWDEVRLDLKKQCKRPPLPEEVKRQVKERIAGNEEQVKIFEEGEEALNQLMIGHARWVVKKATRNNNTSFLNDIIHEGILGIRQGALHYKAGSRNGLLALADSYVNLATQNHNARNGRIPVKPELLRIIRWFEANQDELEVSLGRHATREELAERLGITEESVEAYKRALSWHQVSLDSQVSQEYSGNKLADTIGADQQTVEEIAEENEAREKIEQALGELKGMEKTILVLRFGLDGQRPRTLQEVGAHFGKTRERIRQIEVGALAKLREDQALAKYFREAPEEDEMDEEVIEEIVTAIESLILTHDNRD